MCANPTSLLLLIQLPSGHLNYLFLHFNPDDGGCIYRLIIFEFTRGMLPFDVCDFELEAYSFDGILNDD